MLRGASITAVGTATLLFMATSLYAAENTSFGFWREPTGSIIRVAPCGRAVCATLLAVSREAPSQFDIHNPNTASRDQRLCGLQIGKGFHEDGSDHLQGGSLYDPKSGKTYHGEMTAHGDSLQLRGYVGIKLFGRSETWTRTSAPPPCPKS
jgi:uncharacterized protein (DUF2147 family)